MTAFAARRAKVPASLLDWDVTHGPWYDNNLAILRTTGRGLAMTWQAGTTDGRVDDQATVHVVAGVHHRLADGRTVSAGRRR